MDSNKRIIYILTTLTAIIIVISSSFNIYNSNIKSNRKVESASLSTTSNMIFHASERTEYGDFTGKWFGEGKGNISFGISSGEEVELNRKVKFQLTERDMDDKLLKIIEEEIQDMDTITSATYEEYFSTVLPDQEDRHYMISTEILGENGQAEDTVVSRIYVPNADNSTY